MDGLSNQPDLHDLVLMEENSDVVDTTKRNGSPVGNTDGALDNLTKITTPAKVLMVGEPVLVKNDAMEKENQVEKMADTNTSTAEMSGSSTEELVGGISSPSPETAAAMESALADEDFTSASPKLGEKVPVNFTSNNTRILVKPQSSIMASIKTTQPISIAGKRFTIATQPVQNVEEVARKEGGGPIVTKYIVKRSNTAAAASQKSQIVFAKGSLSSPVKTVNLQSGSILLSPIKGGFKIPVSPMKSPIKVSVIPPTNSKKLTLTSNKPYTIPIQTSIPQLQLRTQPAFSTTNATLVNGLTTPVNKGFSSQQHIYVQNRVVNTNANQSTVTVPTSQMLQQLNVVPNTGALQDPGIKYQYVQLVTPSNNPQQTTLRSNQGQPITFTSMAQLNGGSLPLSQSGGTLTFIQPSIQKYQPAPAKQKGQAVKVTIPSQSPHQIKSQQRLIMPATSLQPIRPNLVNLAPGSILSTAGNVGYAMVPAKYVEQLTKQLSNQATFVPDSAGQSSQKTIPVKVGSNGKLKKPCNCTKSQCLKLYCECFANGQFCDECNCINCSNNLEHEVERSKAIKQCLERNPAAFRPKIGRGKDDNRTHQKGCNCKRSGCLKNYCECYEARIPCTSKCKCIGCKNYEESNDRRTLMSLADAAEVRVQQQTAARTKLSSQIGDIKPNTRTTSLSGERLPYTFFTQEVTEATCTCLLAQAEEAEKTHRPMVVAETMILEEFGRCIMQIIQSAGKAKVTH